VFNPSLHSLLVQAHVEELDRTAPTSVATLPGRGAGKEQRPAPGGRRARDEADRATGEHRAPARSHDSDDRDAADQDRSGGIDATRLPFDPVVFDAAGAPVLLYCNHKLKRDAAMPIDDVLVVAIRAQQESVRARFPEGSRWLFPGPRTAPGQHRATRGENAPLPHTALACR
jgi:hypothetical protein